MECTEIWVSTEMVSDCLLKTKILIDSLGIGLVASGVHGDLIGDTRPEPIGDKVSDWLPTETQVSEWLYTTRIRIDSLGIHWIVASGVHGDLIGDTRPEPIGDTVSDWLPTEI
jgi:hypothetical protein